MSSRVSSLACLVLIGCVATAGAQEPVAPVFRPGVRARIVAEKETYEGILIRNDASEVRLSPLGGGETERIAPASIERVEVFVGRKRRLLLSTVTGAVLYGLIGALLPVDSQNCGEDSPNLCSRSEGVKGGAAFGALVGLWVGYRNPEDQWASVDISEWRPSARRAPLSLSFGF